MRTLWVVLATAAVTVPSSSCAWVLELMPTAQLEGPVIHLQDIVGNEIPGDVGEIVLRADTKPGQQFAISSRQILRRLVTSRLADDLRLTGAETCDITIASRALASETLEPALLQALKPFLRTDRTDAPPSWLEVTSELPQVRYADGWRLELVEPRLLEPGRNLVKVVVDGGTARTRFTASVTVHAFGELGTAVRPVRSGDLLSAEEFLWEWRDLSSVESGLVTSREMLVGVIAASEIPIDSHLRLAQVREMPLVRQGEPVELLLGRDGVEISLRGVARQDGVKGQIVSVRNELNGKLVTGRVLGPGLVAWRK